MPAGLLQIITRRIKQIRGSSRGRENILFACLYNILSHEKGIHSVQIRPD